MKRHLNYRIQSIELPNTNVVYKTQLITKPLTGTQIMNERETEPAHQREEFLIIFLVRRSKNCTLCTEYIHSWCAVSLLKSIWTRKKPNGGMASLYRSFARPNLYKFSNTNENIPQNPNLLSVDCSSKFMIPSPHLVLKLHPPSNLVTPTH